jgi:hypothetical protein
MNDDKPKLGESESGHSVVPIGSGISGVSSTGGSPPPSKGGGDHQRVNVPISGGSTDSKPVNVAGQPSSLKGDSTFTKVGRKFRKTFGPTAAHVASASKLVGNSVRPFHPHPFETKMVILNHLETPRILIAPQAYGDMIAIGSWSGSDEVGWMGAVQQIEHGFLISEIFMVAQKVSGSSTRITEDGLCQLIMEKPELNEKLLFWGHVHPSNSTSPSGQDEEQMEEFKHNAWFIRGIFGRDGRAEFTFFDYRSGVRFNDCPWQLFVSVDPERKEYWRERVETLVTKEYYSPPPKSYYGNYLDGFPGGSQPKARVIWPDDEDDGDDPRFSHGKI